MFGSLAKIALPTVLLAACNSGKITVNGQSVKSNLEKIDEQKSVAPATTGNEPSSAATVVDIADGFSLDRTYVQTRTPLTILLSSELANFGESFSLYNDSTTQTLVKGQALALYNPSDGLTAVQIADFAQTDLAFAPFELTLKIYPLDPEIAGKLTHGENQLRLVVGEDTPVAKRSQRVFTRRDFPLLSLSRSFSAAATQRSGGFEAELGPWMQPAVTNGSSVLTLGVIPLLSR